MPDTYLSIPDNTYSADEVGRLSLELLGVTVTASTGPNFVVIHPVPRQLTTQELETLETNLKLPKPKAWQDEKILSANTTERNSKLARCDWTQLLDAPLTAEKQLEWRTYRQSLRDLELSAESVTWPEEPKP